MIDICFEVPMPPKAHQRATPMYNPHLGRAVMVTPAATRRWQMDLASIAADHMPRVILDEVLRLDILAVLMRPKTKSTKRHVDGLMWAGCTPDVDNIAKNVSDALKSFWVNDSRIADERILKVYAEKGGRPRVLVRIRSLANIAPEKSAAECGLPTSSALDGSIEDTGPPDDFEREQPDLF